MMMMKRKMSVIIENVQGSYSKLGNILYKEKYCLHFRFGNIVVELFSLELLFIKQVE